MTKVVRAPYQAASQELIAKLIAAGYLHRALRRSRRLDRDGHVAINPFETGLYRFHVLRSEIHLG